MDDYRNFVAEKLTRSGAEGLKGPFELHQRHFAFQRDLVSWALRRGKAAIFASTGLGKTGMELDWAKIVCERTDEDVLILAPLAVAQQTVREAESMGIKAALCRENSDFRPGINVANYERLHKFDVSRFAGIVLDESSIIKHHDAKTLGQLINMFESTPFKLCATATPAPNDYTELGTHAEFLDVCSRSEILSEYFCHDGGETATWRLKGHARKAFWQFVASWGAMVRMPSDLGYDDGAFKLPPLRVEHHIIPADKEVVRKAGLLFAQEASTLSERREARRASIGARTQQCVNLIARGSHGSDERREPDLHEGVLPSEQAQMEGAHPGAAGEVQREAAERLRDGRRHEREDEGVSPGVVKTESRQEEEPETGCSIRNRAERLQGHARLAEWEVRDLWIQRHEQSELLSGGGPLPRYRKSQGPALHELQPSSRKVQGRRECSMVGSRVLGEKWLIWCELNDEQDELELLLGNEGISYVSIRGNTDLDRRVEYEAAWREGSVDVMVSKPSVFGWGLNWQHCSRVAFIGVTDSFEAYYQAVRRCWRFGQTRPVDVHVFASELEGSVVKNLLRKEADSVKMATELSAETRELVKLEVQGRKHRSEPYQPTKTVEIPAWLKTA